MSEKEPKASARESCLLYCSHPFQTAESIVDKMRCNLILQRMKL